MFFLPNEFMMSLVFVLCGGIVLAVGLLLINAVDADSEKKDDKDDEDRLPEMS